MLPWAHRITPDEATTMKGLFGLVGSSLTVGIFVGLSACTAAPPPTAPTVAAVATAASPAAATAVAVASPLDTQVAAASPAAVSPAAAPPTSTSTGPASEPEPAPPTEGVVERSRVTGTGDDGLSLRAEPGSASERLKTIPDGAELELTGEEQEADGRTWRAVRDPSDGMTGWVAAEFLEIGGSGE